MSTCVPNKQSSIGKNQVVTITFGSMNTKQTRVEKKMNFCIISNLLYQRQIGECTFEPIGSFAYMNFVVINILITEKSIM